MQKLFGLCLLGLSVFSLNATAQTAITLEEKPFLSPLFSDNMILQRDIAAPIFGWTTPGAEVKVTMSGKTLTTTAGDDGKWIVKLPKQKAGGNYSIAVVGAEKAVLNNVTFGDIWVCSGQSNMEWGIKLTNNPMEEINAANYPNIRLFTVQKRIAYTPVTGIVKDPQNLYGVWSPTTSETVGKGGGAGFSAVAYFFGRELHKELGVPIGLINTSWGGTIAEAWVSKDSLSAMPDFTQAIAQIDATGNGTTLDNYERKLAIWMFNNDKSIYSTWRTETPDPASGAWSEMALPNAWEDAGLKDFDGMVWFRKEIELPESVAGKEATLNLGAIDDMDTTWVNGNRVGGMNVHNAVRTYKLPAGTLKPGKNIIAVRVLDTGGGGGLNGIGSEMFLKVGDETIVLAGTWQYKVADALAKLPPLPAQQSNNPNLVTVLNNGMIHPLLPFAIKGAIWYQGESNAGRAEQYQTLLPTLITDWRKQFGVGDFPFYIVQLANFLAQDAEPKSDPWPLLREAQTMTAQKVKNAGIAVAIDIGDEKDIHPRNKQEVGRRLALNALAKTYRKRIAFSGPTYKSMERKSNAIVIRFDNLNGGLMTKGGDNVMGFAIAGEDKKYVYADARVVGDTIVVSSDKVANPVHVRYAWANNPVANLYNKADLPAVPFRTDNW